MKTPNGTRQFELRTFPHGKEYGLAIYSRGSQDEDFQRVVRIWGAPQKAITDHIIGALKKSGYNATSLSPKRKKPFELEEEQGVRLGLLFMAVKPLRKYNRMEAISNRMRNMGSEEAYYWYSKCTSGENPRRSRRSFRILEAKE
jgi:hypothetical protein